MGNFKDNLKFTPKDKNVKDFPYYKMYEKNGSLVGRINPKHELRQNKWLAGVSCFVINEKNEVLLERRAGKGLTPGKIDLVSGHIDKEETPHQAITRELQEEIGIKINANNNLKYIATMPLIFKSGESRRRFNINFFCCKYNGETITTQKDEVDSVFWLPMNEVFELIRNGKTKFPYNAEMEEMFRKLQNQKSIEEERE